jgi:purine-binding chemotaxis protein CheW
VSQSTLTEIPSVFAQEARQRLEDLMQRLGKRLPEGTLELLSTTTARPHRPSAPRHVVFELNDVRYAVPLENVREIQQLPTITPLPRVPDWLSGITNWRGEVLSVVDLRLLLKLPPLEPRQSQRLLIVHSTVEEIATGWIVDRLIGLRGIARQELRGATLEKAVPPSFIRGIADVEGHFVGVLDVNRVLASPELRQFEATWPTELAAET